MSFWKNKHMLEDYIDKKFADYDSLYFAEGLPLIIDDGIIFLSTALTSELMRMQKVKNVYEIELYYSEKQSFFNDLELVTSKLDVSYEKILLTQPFSDKLIRNASYCDDRIICEDLMTKQQITLQEKQVFDIIAILTGKISYKKEFALFVVVDIVQERNGIFKFIFKRLVPRED